MQNWIREGAYLKRASPAPFIHENSRRMPNSNRKVWLLESGLSHRKQAAATSSNRKFLRLLENPFFRTRPENCPQPTAENEGLA
jgi:hypothetical protein